MSETQKQNFAVFVSGTGSNMEAIIQKVKSGFIPANLALILSDRKAAPAREKAKRAGIKEVYVPADLSIENLDERRAEHETRILPIMKEHKIDFIILAGYMKLIQYSLLDKYLDRIINIHPSLLPLFPGKSGYKDTFNAFKAGKLKEKFGGNTIHLIDKGMDSGPIILQSKVPIFETDTFDDFKDRGLAKEHEVYPQVIKKFAEGKIKIQEIDGKKKITILG